ncbi:MAG: flagellar export chaperone FliS [Lachnospiraceae bacterium]|nr:flagellar export chaperone FliS [Lachnospiraceae bacterium]
MAFTAAAANAYQGTKIKTASPAELTLMLYDGSIKFCNMARSALEKNDYENTNKYIQKARKIIVEFRNNLDFNYPVAQDFDRVYEYIYYTLVDANVKKDITLLDEALGRIKEMRETWIEVMEKVKNAG